MTKFMSIIFVSAMALTAHAADQTDAKYYQLSKVKVTDVTAQYAQKGHMAQAGLLESCDPAKKKIVTMTSDSPVDVNPLDTIGVIVDQVINIGKKIWAILDAGRPVVNITTYTANALPQGLTCWADLTGWNIPQSKVYRVTYENGFGADVVDFAYRVTYTAGGSLNGKGKYLTNATIMPADVAVSWGFTLNAQAEVPSVFNTGSKEDPVAGMQMLMKWQVKTVIDDVQQAESFYVGGDNTLKHME
jgi:hypothetical protein